MGMRTGTDVKLDTILECYYCGAEHTVQEWDNNSYAKCVNRAMRRDYISLTRNKAYTEHADTLYLCPSCDQWVDGVYFVNPPLSDEDVAEYETQISLESLPELTTLTIEDLTLEEIPEITPLTNMDLLQDEDL